MTLAQALDYLKRRHNAATSTYWSDEELYALISARANIVASQIGVMQETDASTTTVASTQAYDLPSDCISISKLYWDGNLLQEITAREWEEEKLSGTTPEGDPEKYFLWDYKAYLVPIPSSAETLTFYYLKEHPHITASKGTIDLPPALHYCILDGVLSDMYSKTQNASMAQFFETKFDKHLAVTIPRYLVQSKNGSRNKVVIDADTAISGGHGIY